jgi:hypothetical protein
VLAAILGSLPKTGGSLADHTVLLSGGAAWEDRSLNMILFETTCMCGTLGSGRGWAFNVS